MRHSAQKPRVLNGRLRCAVTNLDFNACRLEALKAFVKQNKHKVGA